MAKHWIFRAIGALVLAISLAVGSGVQAQTPMPTENTAFASYAGQMQLAGLALQQGNWPVALVASKAAFATARTDLERLTAARLVASAHFRAGQHIRAEWWLRRALNNAIKGPQTAAVRQDFAVVRQANPLTVQLSFNAAPNSNVNNATFSETIFIQTLFGNLPFTLGADSRALSGYELSGSVDLRYRLAQSQNFATDIGLLLFARTFWLTPTAAQAAPTVSGSDFSFAVAEVMLSHTRNIANFPGPTALSLHLGKNWYGGAPYTDYARASLGQKFRLSDSTGLDLTARYEHQISKTNTGVVSGTSTLGATLSHQLANRDALGLNLALGETRSDDPGMENTSLKLGVSYGFSKPVLGTGLSLNLAAEQQNYDFSIYDISGRRDLTVSAGVNIVFLETTYFGFSPTMALEANRTASNIAQFNRETVALKFGLRSTF